MEIARAVSGSIEARVSQGKGLILILRVSLEPDMSCRNHGIGWDGVMSCHTRSETSCFGAGILNMNRPWKCCINVHPGIQHQRHDQLVCHLVEEQNINKTSFWQGSTLGRVNCTTQPQKYFNNCWMVLNSQIFWFFKVAMPCPGRDVPMDASLRGEDFEIREEVRVTGLAGRCHGTVRTMHLQRKYFTAEAVVLNLWWKTSVDH